MITDPIGLLLTTKTDWGKLMYVFGRPIYTFMRKYEKTQYDSTSIVQDCISYFYILYMNQPEASESF